MESSGELFRSRCPADEWQDAGAVLGVQSVPNMQVHCTLIAVTPRGMAKTPSLKNEGLPDEGGFVYFLRGFFALRGHLSRVESTS